jgi:hypothetical protein
MAKIKISYEKDHTEVYNRLLKEYEEIQNRKDIKLYEIKDLLAKIHKEITYTPFRDEYFDLLKTHAILSNVYHRINKQTKESEDHIPELEMNGMYVRKLTKRSFTYEIKVNCIEMQKAAPKIEDFANKLSKNALEIIVKEE